MDSNSPETAAGSVEGNGGGSSSARSATGFSVVNREELIDKMEQLKTKFQFGIQFAYVFRER